MRRTGRLKYILGPFNRLRTR